MTDFTLKRRCAVMCAIEESKRFIDRAQVLIERIDDKASGYDVVYKSKLNSDVKRSSLDLTRSLAKMRSDF